MLTDKDSERENLQTGNDSFFLSSKNEKDGMVDSDGSDLDPSPHRGEGGNEVRVGKACQ